MEESKKIFTQINEVMKEMGAVTKDKTNAQQGYKFRGVDAAMNAFKPILAKHGVFPAIVKIEDLSFDAVTSKAGAQGSHGIKRLTIRFYATDGSFIDVQSDGEAIDYGDKTCNKVMSVAYREALFKTLVVPFETEDIEDTNHDLKPTAPAVKHPTSAAITPTPTGYSSKEKLLTDPQKNMIFKQLDRLEIDVEVYESKIGRMISTLPMAEASKCIDALIARQKEPKPSTLTAEEKQAVDDHKVKMNTPAEVGPDNNGDDINPDDIPF
jgi:hypothetical protein